jgi:nucleotide-binding universal stress UspA family protein
MYTSLITPVDLAHADKLAHALDVAADLAGHYKAKLCYVGVTTPTPNTVAHTPAEYAERLADFARTQGAAHGIKVTSHAELAHDPAIDLDRAVLHAAEAEGADLIVMASHVPGLADHLWPSNGGKVAAHAKISVMLVRA